MTIDDIIRMARGAGCNDEFVKLAPDWLERFAALVAAAERKECLDWCAAYAADDGTAQKIAAAIRARGQA